MGTEDSKTHEFQVIADTGEDKLSTVSEQQGMLQILKKQKR